MKMTQEELLELHKEMCRAAYELIKAKNTDYTANHYALKNFQLAEHLGVCASEVGIFTRFLDKVSRVATFLERGVFEVKDESIDDTLLDMMNYAVILKAQLQEKRLKKERD